MKLMQDASREKLSGSFYTPEPIADFILKWAMNGDANYDILEPGCGDYFVKATFRPSAMRRQDIGFASLESM